MSVVGPRLVGGPNVNNRARPITRFREERDKESNAALSSLAACQVLPQLRPLKHPAERFAATSPLVARSSFAPSTRYADASCATHSYTSPSITTHTSSPSRCRRSSATLIFFWPFGNALVSSASSSREKRRYAWGQPLGLQCYLDKRQARGEVGGDSPVSDSAQPPRFRTHTLSSSPSLGARGPPAAPGADLQ